MKIKPAHNSGFARFGLSVQFKVQFVLANISEKIKNWEGFPQTSQSHKTLGVILSATEATKEYF